MKKLEEKVLKKKTGRKDNSLRAQSRLSMCPCLAGNPRLSAQKVHNEVQRRA